MYLASRLIAVAMLLSLSPSALAQPTQIDLGTSNAAAEARYMAMADTPGSGPYPAIKELDSAFPVTSYTVPATCWTVRRKKID